jgi:hypothetical protein
VTSTTLRATQESQISLQHEVDHAAKLHAEQMGLAKMKFSEDMTQQVLSSLQKGDNNRSIILYVYVYIDFIIIIIVESNSSRPFP